MTPLPTKNTIQWWQSGCHWHTDDNSFGGVELQVLRRSLWGTKKVPVKLQLDKDDCDLINELCILSVIQDDQRTREKCATVFRHSKWMWDLFIPHGTSGVKCCLYTLCLIGPRYCSMRPYNHITCASEGVVHRSYVTMLHADGIDHYQCNLRVLLLWSHIISIW